MAERVPRLPSKSTEQSPGNGEAQPVTSSTLGNPRGCVFRFSACTTRNRRIIGSALTVIVICLAIIPLVRQTKILSPPSSPAGFTTGDEWQSGMLTSSILAPVAQPPTAVLTFSPSSPAAGYPVTLNETVKSQHMYGSSEKELTRQGSAFFAPTQPTNYTRPVLR